MENKVEALEARCVGNVQQKWWYYSPLFYKLTNWSGWITRRYILCEEGRLDYSTVLSNSQTHTCHLCHTMPALLDNYLNESIKLNYI